MSGNGRSTEQLTAVTDCRDLTRSAAVTQELPARDLEPVRHGADDSARRLMAFAAGAVLLVVGVAGLHNLYRAGDGIGELVKWSGPLLLWLSCLGGGIKLAVWGAGPVTAAVFDVAKAQLTAFGRAVVAAGAVIAGALGMWWTFRGGYVIWWQQVSAEHQWTLLLGVGQMLVAVLAGAALFTGGRYLVGLAKVALTEAGLVTERGRADHRDDSAPSHPALLTALIVGGGGLVVMAAWLTPKLAPTIAGANVLPAIAAIAAVLLWAIGSNLGWWKGLVGLYKWATDASQKAGAVAGVAAVLMFSASGLGLGWFTPATVPQAHAACPPDCGGGGGLDGPPGGGQMFQPPSQGGQQMPDYQGGNNRAPMDQNGSVSIYNTQVPSVSNNGTSGSNAQQGPQQGWDQPAHGTQIPDYQNATPYTQGPGRPNPDFNPGSQGAQSNPGSNAGSQGGQANQGAQSGNQGAQQPQQPPSQNSGQQPQNQPPQNNTGQEPNQQPQQSDQQRLDELSRQLQDQQQQSGQDRQRIDDLTKQLQQQGQQKQNGNQKLPKAPSKDKKKDDQQDRDKQSGDNDTSALLLGAASTRRRKQDDQQQPEQSQQQGPDTQALAQDGAQLGQSLPGDIANTVSDSVNLGQSAGSAAQNFGSAAQAGASIASSAQSGAVNPMDAVEVVQGFSGGISDTADAVSSGASIASTWINNAGQGAQLAADVNPQLKPQAEQVQQLTQAGGQVADLTGQVAGGVSQVSGVVNSVSSLGASGMPDTSGATDALSGTATAVDVPKPTPPPLPQPSSGVQGLDSTTTRAPQQPPQPSNPSTPKTANQTSTSKPLSPLEASALPAPLQALNTAQAASTPTPSTPNPAAGSMAMLPGVRDTWKPPTPSTSPSVSMPLDPSSAEGKALLDHARQYLLEQKLPPETVDAQINKMAELLSKQKPVVSWGQTPATRQPAPGFADGFKEGWDGLFEGIRDLGGQGEKGVDAMPDAWRGLLGRLADGPVGSTVHSVEQIKDAPSLAYGFGVEAGQAAPVIATLPFGGEGAAVRAARPGVASVEEIGGWLKQINSPGISTPGRAVNCGNCALAIEHRLSGHAPDATAGLGTLSISEMEAATGFKQVSMSPDQIAQNLIKQGPGAHTIVGVDRANGVAGHWFNAYYDGQNVWAIDGQVGKIFGWPPNMDAPGAPVTHWDMGVLTGKG
ncbi:toxin glutamine deamidase domain-containing protein [Mycobacteroides chelonae]|uniref:toxin glutamine deamidase domain-containing protein n=1 Tax=Mycobacteroides chelonae TaxID=1774 RepID=UPI000A6C0474